MLHMVLIEQTNQLWFLSGVKQCEQGPILAAQMLQQVLRRLRRLRHCWPGGNGCGAHLFRFCARNGDAFNTNGEFGLSSDDAVAIAQNGPGHSTTVEHRSLTTSEVKQ